MIKRALEPWDDRDMLIRETKPEDLDVIQNVQRSAFGGEAEADLTAELLSDPSAAPRLSLLAYHEHEVAGHILFTKTELDNVTRKPRCSILAPLAVVPSHQGHGFGKTLIRHGVTQLTDMGVDLVFVLGYPGYYNRHGFVSAEPLGFSAPYPIPDKHSDAWMVRPLGTHVIGSVSGTVRCADALTRPELWRE